MKSSVGELKAIILDTRNSDETRIEAIHQLMQIGTLEQIMRVFTRQLDAHHPTNKRVNRAIMDILLAGDKFGRAKQG